MTHVPSGVPAQSHAAAFGWLFAAAWLLAAWKPLYPGDWALENVLSLLAAWWLVRRHRRHPLSNPAYLLLLVFGVAHEVGSHYTYAEVPYDAWSERLTGVRVSALCGFDRNHYDRLVHLLFGLLCYRPMREVLAPQLPPRGAAPALLTAAVITSISGLYEILEWVVALVFGGDLGQAYLGTQGDVWDSHKDMALALLGVVVAIGAETLSPIRVQPHCGAPAD